MPRPRPRFSQRATVAAISAAVLVPVIAMVILLHGGGSAGVDAFNACIGQKHFLVTTKHGSGHRVIDTVNDRATGALVGVFAVLPSLRAAETFTSSIGPPSGTGEGNGRMVLFTNVPSGRDANAIMTCSIPEFPLTP
jgi:hypothetical protein